MSGLNEVRIGLIGFGYWGPNLLRNFHKLAQCNVKKVVDKSDKRLDVVRNSYPTVITSNDANDIFNDSDIDAVIIATPVFSHYTLAKQALLKGKHVLVEKPMTASTAEAKELIELANQRGLTLMVDHTFLYTGAVRHIKKLMDEGVIGDVQYLDSTRINLGLFQHDVNVLWDLAPHDISICNYLLNAKPISVQAVGVSHIENDIENIAYLTLRYANNLIAHFNCSWISPVKIRQMLIGGSKKMVLYNDMEPTEKIKVYDTGYNAHTNEEVNNIKIDYRTGDIHVPKISMTEALSLMAEDFVKAIQTGEKPQSDAILGLNVVEILEAAQKSIKQHEEEIQLA